MKSIFDILSDVSNFPELRERASLSICSWKAEHEDIYTDFKNKMNNISTGDLSTLEEMFSLASDCLSNKAAGMTTSSMPGYGTAEGIWQNLPQYAKSYIAETSKKDGKATKEDSLSLIEESVDYMNTCMSFVPSFVSNLKAKAKNTIETELKKIERCQLLILDEAFLVPLDAKERPILLEIIEDRHDRKSIVMASQLPVENWYDAIGEIGRAHV